jgi:coenzyme F420 hydrogenase subunit beta
MDGLNPNAPPALLAWAADSRIRRESSSGGFTKAMLAWLVAEGRVDCAVVTRMREPFRAETIATADPIEIVTPQTNSVYHMAPVLQAIPEDRSSAVVALPCQIEAIRRGQASGRFAKVRYLFELMCNQVPGPGWRASLLSLFGVDAQDVARVVYRGGGWPGRVLLETKDGRELVERWGRRTWHNSRWLPRHCQACRRLTCGGDYLVGDPWGLPPREIGDGKTLVVPRAAALGLPIASAAAAGAIQWQPLDPATAAIPLGRHLACKQARDTE